MKILNKIFYLALIGSSVSSAWAYTVKQSCDDTGIRSTPTTDFKDNGDGTVFHKKTGLTWMQCPFSKHQGMPTEEGGAYTVLNSDGTCKDATEYPLYKSTVDAPKDIDALRKTKGGEHWRLPTIKELASLQEDHCINPPLNLEVFKMTSDFLLNWDWLVLNGPLNRAFLSKTIYANYSDSATSAGKMATPVYFSFPVSAEGAEELKVNSNLPKYVGEKSQLQGENESTGYAQVMLLLVRDDK